MYEYFLFNALVDINIPKAVAELFPPTINADISPTKNIRIPNINIM